MTKYQKSLALFAAGMLCLAVAVSVRAEGKAVYDQKCASCHGKDGKGNAAMVNVFKVDKSALDLTDKATLDKSDADLIAITNKGEGKMPAYDGKIPAADIAAAVAYSRSLAGGTTAPATGEKSEAAPAGPKADLTAAAGAYQAKCASCHGKDGKGNPAMVNVFKVDKSALDLTDATTQGKSAADLAGIVKKGAGKMPAYDGKLKDDEVNSLTAYIKSLGGK